MLINLTALQYTQKYLGRQLSVGKALSFAKKRVVVSKYSCGMRRDVAKVVILVLASPSKKIFSEKLKLLSIDQKLCLSQLIMTKRRR